MSFSTIASHVAVVVGFLLAVFAVAELVRQRRSPQSTIAWLLAIVLVPYVGVPLFLLIGGRKRRRLMASKATLRLADTQPHKTEDIHPLDRMIRAYDMPGATLGNRLVLAPDGEAGFRQLLDVIDSATQTLDITIFIFQLDESGRAVLDRLVEKARGGVKVRVILDAIGCVYTSRTIGRELAAVGGCVATFMRVFSPAIRRRIDLRSHRKIVVADGRRVWAGGANIGEEYIGPTPTDSRWIDLSFVVEGPAANVYWEIFRNDWEFASGETLDPRPSAATPLSDVGAGAELQVLPSGPDVAGDPLYDAIVSAIYSADWRLWAVTPYFVPDESLLTALLLAARRGVDVRLVLPRRSNHPLTDLVRGASLRELQAAGVTVELLGDRMLHAKALLVDDNLALLGTANLDVRSLFLNYEVDLVVYSPAEIHAVEGWFSALRKRTEVGVREVGAVREIVEGVARIAGPLL